MCSRVQILNIVICVAGNPRKLIYEAYIVMVVSVREANGCTQRCCVPWVFCAQLVYVYTGTLYVYIICIF